MAARYNHEVPAPMRFQHSSHILQSKLLSAHKGPAELLFGRVIAILLPMNAVTFDTLDFVKELESSGFTEEQAEALARAQKKINEINLENLTTKGDLHTLKTDLPLDLKEMEIRLIKWMVGSLSVLFALLKFLN